MNYGHQAPGAVRKVFAAPIALWQRVVFTWGPLRTLRLRWPAVALLVAPIAVAGFDYRYLIPVIPFAALAAGLAFAPRKGTGADVPPQPQAEAESPVLRSN